MADIPPANVDVPVPADLITPPVNVRPAEDARPPPAACSPEAVNVDVAVAPDSRSILPSVRVNPPEEESPPPASERPAEDHVDVAEPVVTMVDVDVNGPVFNAPVISASPSMDNLLAGVVVPLPMFEYPSMFPVACSVEDAYTLAPVDVANTSAKE